MCAFVYICTPQHLRGTVLWLIETVLYICLGDMLFSTTKQTRQELLLTCLDSVSEALMLFSPPEISALHFSSCKMMMCEFKVSFVDTNGSLQQDKQYCGKWCCTVLLCSTFQLTSLGTSQHLAPGCDSAKVGQLQAIM